MNDSDGNIASNVDSFEAKGTQSDNDWKICDKKTIKTSKISLDSSDQTSSLSKNDKTITNDVYNQKSIEIVLNLMNKSTKSVIILRGMLK